MADHTTRISTGVPGLDPLIEGGLLRGGVYMVQGPPGAGKTIFANQLCCHHARNGGRAIYVTLLCESHAAMFSHLERMTFFCSDLIGNAVVYFSGFKVLEDEGFAGLAKMVGKAMADRSPTVVIVDGFVTITDAVRAPNDLKQFVRQIQTFSASVGSATVLLSSATAGVGIQPEHTIVDGVIELSDDLNGMRSLRHLQIPKMRGTRQVRGRHTVQIDDEGMTVHARFEAEPSKSVQRPEARPSGRAARRPTGIAELDTMLHGGLPAGSNTMLLGASGVGKTTIALQYTSTGAQLDETALFFGMYEQPEDLLQKARSLGIPLEAGLDAGKIHMMWERPIEGVLDVLADRLIARLRATGATRLCIDGMHSLFRTVDFPERMRAVTAALAEELATLGVTTVYTLETPDLISPQGAGVRAPLDDLSAMAQNIITLRLCERDGQYDRMLAITKMRDSGYDRTIREMTITDHGIVIAPPERDSNPRGGSRSTQGATP